MEKRLATGNLGPILGPPGSGRPFPARWWGCGEVAGPPPPSPLMPAKAGTQPRPGSRLASGRAAGWRRTGPGGCPHPPRSCRRRPAPRPRAVAGWLRNPRRGRRSPNRRSARVRARRGRPARAGRCAGGLGGAPGLGLGERPAGRVRQAGGWGGALRGARRVPAGVVVFVGQDVEWVDEHRQDGHAAGRADRPVRGRRATCSAARAACWRRSASGPLTNLFALWNSDRLALAAHGAQEVDAGSAPELVAMVHGLARRAGLPMPRVYVIDDAQPNAFATGREPGQVAPWRSRPGCCGR